jgi:hypothetical protein
MSRLVICIVCCFAAECFGWEKMSSREPKMIRYSQVNKPKIGSDPQCLRDARRYRHSTSSRSFVVRSSRGHTAVSVQTPAKNFKVSPKPYPKGDYIDPYKWMSH